VRPVEVDVVEHRTHHVRVHPAQVEYATADQVLVVLVVLDHEGDHVGHRGEQHRVGQ
jgi:hypothetical protein